MSLAVRGGCHVAHEVVGVAFVASVGFPDSGYASPLVKGEFRAVAASVRGRPDISIGVVLPLLGAPGRRGCTEAPAHEVICHADAVSHAVGTP